MASKRFDVVIAGGGPAGSTAAYFLARAGLNVAVLDNAAFPRYKTCGGGIVFRAAKLLPFDIDPVIERRFNKIEVSLLSSRQQFEIIREEPIISMTMRDKFDNLLLNEAVKEGTVLVQEADITNLKKHKNIIEINTNTGTYKSEFLIAADGSLGSTAKKAGWQETRNLIPALECEVYLYKDKAKRLIDTTRFDFDLIPDGYAWVFPKKDHLSIGVLSMNRGHINLTGYFNRYLKFLGISNFEKIEKHGFVIPVKPRTDAFTRDRVILIGDVAGLADPITAEGISNAILSGKIAANAIIHGNHNPKKVEKIYAEELHRKILGDLAIGRKVAHLLYSYPKIRTLLFRFYGNKLTEAITQVFMNENSYHKIITNPVNYLKLLRIWNP